LRPDAERADPESREINPFKQALNIFMFGSRDPSNLDIGEMRAGHIQKKYVYDALLAAPPGDPARSQVVATMGAMGAQAAQSMRERYYAKEYKQMVATQIIPLVQEKQEAEEIARAEQAISIQAVPRHLGQEEGAAIRDVEQAGTTVAPEILSKGKTAEGKDKGQTQVAGVAEPTPNSALETPGQVAGTIFDPETPSYMDPITGVPVPIAGQRGQQIHQESMDKWLGAQNKIMLKMMDVLASYGGNPMASAALQKMIEDTSAMAGAAVTGRMDPMEQTEWYDNQAKTHAQTQALETESEQGQLQLQQAGAQIRAGAADALELANSDPEFRDMLGKRLQKLIDSGKGIEDMTSKQIQDLAAMASMHRDLQKEDLRKQAAAGMIAVAPARLGVPTTWMDHMGVNDERFIESKKVKFAELVQGIQGDVNKIQSYSQSEREKWFDELNVPSDVRGLIATGQTGEKPVKDWINRRVTGSEEFKDALGEAYMERLEHGMQEQPGLEEAILAHNEDWLAAYIAKFPTTPPETMEYMRTDVLGTHYRYAQGREATEWRPPIQALAIENYKEERARIDSGEAAQMQRGAAEQVAQQPVEQMTAPETQQMMSNAQARPAATASRPTSGEYLQRMNVDTLPDDQITGETPPAAMNQSQLSTEIERLNRLLLTPEVMRDPQLQQDTQMRLAELREHHVNIGERMLFSTIGAVKDFFTDSPEEEAAAAEKLRIQQGEILRFIPGQKVN
jgi:hypothetical protein